MDINYHPEIDVTPVLSPELVTRYQNLIGVLRWATELGHIDILHEVCKLSSYNAQPREGHLEAIYQVFVYLKKHENSRIVFDRDHVIVPDTMFNEADWNDFYPDAEEMLPPNMILPLGEGVEINCFVDADHAGNVAIRRSHTGIIIFINNAPILWYSKRQNTVESSTFGSEFNALRIATDMIQALRYKLRMFGVKLNGPANVFCDNQGVVLNSS